ncbi:HAD hydrolase-like protein [Methylobacterium durans]|uniref:HAD hydrolase-like protein n=1 Tax=Methylobacterium durans TaxID=2202825 RepID=UPI002AFFB2ED|nr:HAD hydrolase-like protein [Methylobacterium durans]MEA1832428.1 HAD hydrolase-like protein [Methylobacterium durans]
MTDVRPPAPYALVVLDFDGTLADSFPWFCSVINGVADRYGFRRIAEEEVESLRALGAREIVARLGVPLWKLPAISRHMHALASRDIDAMRLFPGVPEALTALARREVRLAVLSSNTEANVRRVLGPDLAALVEAYACGASLFGKARRLSALIRRCGVAPEGVLSVGDEIRDAEAARGAGCAFAAVAWGYTRADALRESGPDHLFAEPGEIARLLAGAPVAA